MANRGAIQQAIGPLQSDLRKSLTAIFDYVLKNWRFGRPGDQVPAENFKGVFLQATTPAVANTEFSIEHGLETAPYLVIPVLDLNVINSRAVDLTVTRAADSRRVYFSSTVTGAAITVFVEG